MHGALATFFGSFLFMLLVLRAALAAKSTLSRGGRIVVSALASFGLVQLAIWFYPEPGTLVGALAGIAAATLAMPEPGLQRLTEALGRARLPLYLLAVLTLAALIYVFVPITTFLTSPGELSIHLDYLLTSNARDVMLLVYVAAAIYALAISERMRTALTVLALGGLALALLYSYALPFGYPMMSGLAFEQIPISALARVPRILADLAIVALVALLLSWGLLRWGGKRFVAGVLIVNVSLCMAAGAALLRERVGEAGGQDSANARTARPLKFSRTQPNVLFIFLDRFMGSYVESILESDPQLAARMSGFTWYPRSVSAGQNSIAGVHPMLGGYDYLPVAMNERNQPLRDLSVEAFAILPYNFSRQGYHVNVVNPRGLAFTMEGDCRFLEFEGVTCSHIPKTLSKNMADRLGIPLNELAQSNYTSLLVLLGAMRGAPYVTKEIVLRRGPWQPFLDHSAGTTFREWAELHAWPELTDTAASGSNMNYISNILAHEPYYMGEDCRPRQQRLMYPDAVLKQRGHPSLFSLQHAVAARCTLLGVADYLDYLKSAGVYDNTRIIIVSDHGIVGDVTDTSSRARAGGTTADAYLSLRPLLMLKPRNAQGPLVVSEEFMPNAEAPRMACEEIGGCVNPYLGGKAIATLGRDDPFYVSIVPWQFSLQNPRSFVIQEQLALVGKDPFDARGWRKLGAKPAPRALTATD
jgi:hypothetical protein